MNGTSWAQPIRQKSKAMKFIAIFFSMLTACLTWAAAPGQAGQSKGLFISPEYAATQIRQASRIQLVDVRNKTEFDKLHIPESIHAPLHFVKTKTWLQPKTAVLVNQGFCKQALIQTCRELHKKGFTVKILKGGLTAWIQKGLPVTGDPFAKKAISRVSPRQVFQAYAARFFLPVDISGRQTRQLFSGTVHPETGGAFQTALERFRQDHPNGSVLVFNQTGTGYENSKEAIISAGKETIFFLSGGVNAYKEYLANRKRARTPKSERMQSTRQIPCRSCKQ